MGNTRIAGDNHSLIEIYPNPTRDVVNVLFRSEQEQLLEIQLLNTLGKNMYQEVIDFEVPTYFNSLDLSNYARGMYLIKVKTTEGIQYHKLNLQ